MSAPGAATTVSVQAGRSRLAALPWDVMQSLRQVQVTLADEGDAAFQASFTTEPGYDAGGRPPFDPTLFAPFNRIALTAALDGKPVVLMDGVVTRQRLVPSTGDGQATLVVEGRDLSAMMDLHQVSREFPSQTPEGIVRAVLGAYGKYGVTPKVESSGAQAPSPRQRVPIQNGTDLQWIRYLAGLYGFVFYVRPGDRPGQSEGYWGPPLRGGTPQRALVVNQGPLTSVNRLEFGYDALAATTVRGQVLNAGTHQVVAVDVQKSTRQPALAAEPALTANGADTRTTLLRPWGLDPAAARAYAQGLVDLSTDGVAVCTGDLDSFRYGAVLQPRGTVGVRGAGFGYDGLYQVRSVTHTIDARSWRQSFRLAREGTGSTRNRLPE